VAETILPNEWFKQYPSFVLDGKRVTVMAILRRRVDTPPTLIEPIVLHLKTLKDFLSRKLTSFYRREFSPSTWFNFVSKTIEWGQATGNDIDSSIFGLKLPTTEMALDAYPLMGVQEVSYEYDVTRGSNGRLVLYIPDPILAESTLYMLQNAALTGGYIVQVFVPFLKAEPGGAKWIVSPDLITGLVKEVAVEEWPFKIVITLGDAAAIQDANKKERQVYSGTAREVFDQMAQDLGVKIVWLPIPGGPTQLDTKITIDVGGRPLRDALSAYLTLLDLRYRWLRGFGGVTTILFVWDNVPENDPITTFFTENPSVEAKDIDNILQRFGSWVTENFASLRRPLADIGLYTEGVFNVLVPYNVDPGQAEWLAARYDGSNHGKLMLFVQKFMAGAKLPSPNPQSEGVRSFSTGLARVFDQFHFSHAKFHVGFIQDIGSFRFANPGAQAVQQIASAFPGGVTNIKLQKVKASQAAKKLKLRPKSDGTYEFVSASGTFSAAPNDYVYLSYDPSDEVGGARVFPSGASIPGMGNPEGGGPQVYPYELTFDITPFFGVWPGLPTYIAGFPPLDGGWEMYKIRYELSSYSQKATVFLRTDRIPIYAK